MTQEEKIFAVVCSILIVVVAALSISLFRANRIINAQGELIQEEKEYIESCDKLIAIQEDILGLQKKQ